MMQAQTTRNMMSPGPWPGQLTPQPGVVGGDAGVFRLGIATVHPAKDPASTSITRLTRPS